MKRNFTRIFGGMRSFILTTALLTAGGGAAFAADYSVTPEPGEVESLKDVVIMWGQSMLTFGEGDILLSVNGKPEEVIEPEFTPGQNFGYFQTPGNVTIKFRPQLTDPGMYYITIPAGYVTVNQTGEPNEEIILAYEIVSSGDNPGGSGDNPGGATIPTPTFSPANYATVESISEVKIDWGIELEEGSLGQGFFSSVNVFKNGEYFSYPAYEEIEGTSVILYFEPEITEAGNYEIQIPEYYVYFPTLGDDVTNPDLSIYYFIEGGNEEPSEGIKPTGITPESGSTISELNTVTINWEQRYINKGEVKATISKDGGEPQDITDMISTANGSPFGGTATATINFNGAFNEAGEYKITLPAGTFNLASNMFGEMEGSAEIVLTYTVTGEQVEHPAPDYTVTPENGSTLFELGEVRIQWGSSLLEEKGGTVTIQFNDNEPVEVEDSGFYPGTEGMMGGLIPGSPGNLTLWFNPAYTEAGTYTITIPEGYVYVKDASTVNGEIVLTYTITGEEFEEPTPSISPASNSEVEKIETVTIDWGISISEGNNMGGFSSTVTVMKDDKEYYESYADGYIEEEKLLIYFYPELTEAGEYEIIIPEDYIRFTAADKPNTEMSIYYTVKENGEEPEPGTGVEPLNIMPEDGSELEELSEIVITWEQKIINEGQGQVTLTHNGETIDITENVESLGSFSAKATTTIKFDDPYTEPGEYVISIPAGFVRLNDALVGLGEPNSEILIEYTIAKTIEPAPEFMYEPDNTAPLESLPNEVKLYFGDRTENLTITGKTEATLTIGEDDPVGITKYIMVDYEEEGEGWDLEFLYYATIDLSEYEEVKGNCTITLPEGFFNIGGFTIAGNLIDGEDSPEVVIVYVIDSAEAVKGISSDADGIYRVYNLNGVLVLSTENALELNNLAKGIYIINGKKYIIR